MKILKSTKIPTKISALLAGFFLSFSAHAEMKARDYVLAIDVKALSSASDILGVLQLLSKGVAVDDVNTVGGVCVGHYGVTGLSDTHPQSTAWLIIKMVWGCDAAHEKLISKIEEYPGVTLLPYNVLYHVNPAVIGNN